jgi:hypothetical protein
MIETTAHQYSFFAESEWCETSDSRFLMIGLLGDMLINHGVAVIFVTTCKVYCLHQVAVVTNCQFEVFAIFWKVGDAEGEYVFHF